MKKEKNNTSKCPICERPIHKESKYCIFHAIAEEKTEEDFKRELIKYVNKIKKEDGDYDFGRFIFIGYIKFKEDLNITIFKNACFEKALFKEVAHFESATFKGKTIFSEAIFEADYVFGGAIFEGAIFEWAIFDGAIFKGQANFLNATFKKGVGFEGAIFEGEANFREAIFEGSVNFTGATFKEDANFQLKKLVKFLNFSKTKTFSGKKLFIRVNKEGVIINFERAYLENAYLNLDLGIGVLIDFTDALLRNTKIEKEKIENHILQEKEKKFTEAQEIYLLLKNNFHSIGQYKSESWAFEKEKEMERMSYSIESFIKNVESEEKKSERKVLKEKKSKAISYFNWFKTKKFRKWLWSCFCNIIYGYGERPQNVIFAAIFIIILFSVLFSLLGINSPEIIEMKSPTVQEIFNGDSEIVSKGNLINKTTSNYIDCFYFSAITFTTLGYGDFRPLEGWGRILAGSEAFIGAFMMALFVYTFARRTGGR